jgi:hypothetical protein
MSQQPDPKKLADAITKVTGATTAIFHNAVHMIRQSGLEAEDLPRICISAACQSVELMLERYHRGLTGEQPMTAAERAEMRETIRLAAEDLALALQQAHLTVTQLAQGAATLPDPEPETRH